MSDVQDLQITPYLERKDYRVKIIERQKTYLIRLAILSVLLLVNLICIPVGLILNNDLHSMVLCFDLFLCIMLFPLLMFFEGCFGSFCLCYNQFFSIKPSVFHDYKVSRLSMPAEYFETTSQRTIDGIEYKLKLNDTGRREIPCAIKEDLILGTISPKFAQVVNSGQGDIVFNISSPYVSVDMTDYDKHETYLYSGFIKKRWWVAQLNGVELPTNDKGVYIPCHEMLTTQEKLDGLN